MQRRKFLIGAGSAAIGSSAILGSSAFGMVWANRDVTATVTGDASANLGFEVRKPEYAKYDGNQFELDVNNLNEDANTRLYNVFWIRNNGSNDISVEANQLDGSGNLAGWNQDALVLYWSENELSEDGSILNEKTAMHDVNAVDDPGGGAASDIPRLSPGEAISVHPQFFIQDNKGNGIGDVPSEISFYATLTNL